MSSFGRDRMTDGMKRCNRCGRELSLSEFHKEKSRKDGYFVWCKECRAEYDANHYTDHKDRINERSAKYRKENKEKIAEMDAEYREEHKDEYKVRQRKYRNCVTKPSCLLVGGRGAEFELFACEVCGKEFRRNKSYVEWQYEHTGYLPRFCSRVCMGVAKRKGYLSPNERRIRRIIQTHGVR